MTQAPVLGERISLAVAASVVRVVRANVADGPHAPVATGTFFWCHDTATGSLSWRRVDEEGITWCRGWKGEAVAALLAAAALVCEPASWQQRAEMAYVLHMLVRGIMAY